MNSIQNLLEYYKKYFPKGCTGNLCTDCPLSDAIPGTFEDKLCLLLANSVSDWGYTPWK